MEGHVLTKPGFYMVMRGSLIESHVEVSYLHEVSPDEGSELNLYLNEPHVLL